MDLKTALAETIAAAAGLPAGEVLEMIETPPDPKMGDADVYKRQPRYDAAAEKKGSRAGAGSD